MAAHARADAFRSEGVRADILIAVVVFLHTAVEDFVRSHFSRKNKKFHFYSASDIRRALGKLRVEPALFADLQWHLAVLAFYYRLRKATGPVGIVENRAAENIERAILKNVEFWQAVAAFSKLPLEKQREGLVKLLEIL
jgi:hypothetical protein